MKSLIISSEESKHDSDLDEPWIMTVKGLHVNSTKTSASTVFSLEEASFNNGNNLSRDDNLNHVKIFSPAQRSPTHQGFSNSSSSSPSREMPESPNGQKSIVFLKEDRYMNESSIDQVKSDDVAIEKDFERSSKEVKYHRDILTQSYKCIS